MPTSSLSHDVKDLALAPAGKQRIEWAFQSMPVLQKIRKEFIKTQPLQDIRVAACLNVTAEAANLLIVLRDGGAEVTLCASDPSSVHDDVAASLVKDYNISAFALKGESRDSAAEHAAACSGSRPNIVMDDGGAMSVLLHAQGPEALEGILGGTEESAKGAIRLKAMAKAGTLGFPVIALSESVTRRLLGNRYGTGQSTIDGILRATNILLAGMNVVVGGYGWCGRGVAARARGLGANVIVTEIDPVKAMEAVLDGYRVMSMSEAAAIGDVFVTVTGVKMVIGRAHFEKMKSGAILCNSGQSNVEIDLKALDQMTSGKRHVREYVEEYAVRDGRKLYLLGEGRLINWASAEGQPASVLDLSLANQALSVRHLLKNRGSLESKVYPAPPEIDREVARMKLESMGVNIDKLTIEQEEYLGGWSESI